MSQNKEKAADMDPNAPGYITGRDMIFSFYARLYAEEASELCRTFGEKGKQVLKEALTEYARRRLEYYGPVRGELRGQAKGCPIRTWLDTYGYTEEADAYCETVCPKLAPELAARGSFTRKGDTCLQNALIPADPAYDTLMAQFQLSQDLFCLNMWALGYHLIQNFGDEGEAAARRALRRYAFERGTVLRKTHEAKGLPITLLTLFTNQDLPRDPRFKRNPIQLDEETRFSETLVCPFNDAWRRNPDGARIGRLYCEEVHIQLWTGWHPKTQVNLSQTLTQDDDRCRFSVYLRPENSIPEPEWIKTRKPNI